MASRVGSTPPPPAADKEGGGCGATNYDDTGHEKDSSGNGSRKDNGDLDAGVGGRGGIDHQTVLLYNAGVSPFLRLNKQQIRQKYHMYVVNN